MDIGRAERLASGDMARSGEPSGPVPAPGEPDTSPAVAEEEASGVLRRNTEPDQLRNDDDSDDGAGGSSGVNAAACGASSALAPTVATAAGSVLARGDCGGDAAADDEPRGDIGL